MWIFTCIKSSKIQSNCYLHRNPTQEKIEKAKKKKLIRKLMVHQKPWWIVNVKRTRYCMMSSLSRRKVKDHIREFSNKNNNGGK